jgi:hypothetical protein
VLPVEESSSRIRKTTPMGRQRIAHSVRISSAADIDKQLKAWLNTAWEISGE